jgi:hypothetical protein
MSALAVRGSSPGAAAGQREFVRSYPSAIMHMSLSGHQRRPATVALGSTLPSKVTLVAIRGPARLPSDSRPCIASHSRHCSMTAFTSPLETRVASAIASINWFLVIFAMKRADGRTIHAMLIGVQLSHWLFERKDLLPVVLHADDGPVFLLCLGIERGGEGTNLGIGQPLRRTIGVLTYCIVVQHKHR